MLQQEGRVIRDLREKYKCKNHDACFIDNGRHLKLTAMHLQLWAKEIVIIIYELYNNTYLHKFLFFFILDSW
jgi:hypothetical protein